MRQRQLSWREMVRRCDELLDGIAVPDPFDLDEFATAVGGRRGRTIRVASLPNEDEAPLTTMGDGARTVCGLLVRFATEDVIVVEPRNWVHRVHVGLHEIAHLVCEHASTAPVKGALRLLPDLDESMVRAVLGRTRYSEEQEREAEALASLLSARLIGPGSGPRGRAGEGADEVMARLERAIGGATEC